MLRKWCHAKKYAHASNLSHVLMDGGVLSIPYDTLDTFYEMYIASVLAGEKIYVVEQKSETYAFFVDIDYKDTRALTIDEIRGICKTIYDKVRRFGGLTCLVSVSEPKPCGHGLTKTGVHMNWPGFIVDQSSAIALREHILVTLMKDREGYDWNEIIDASVYGSLERQTKGSGFRMPWSLKKGKHETCDGQGCSLCENGKIDQGAYLPIFLYKQGLVTTITPVDQTPSVSLLKMAAMRTNQPATVTIEPPVNRIKEGSFTKGQTKDEIQDDRVRTRLETFIRKNMEGQERVRVTKVFKYKDMFLVSSTSKYCENLKRDHGSNHVWFMVNGSQITQKCFCRCETLRGRQDGFCKDFSGRSHEIPSPLKKELYPIATAPSRSKPKGPPRPPVSSEVLKGYMLKNMNVPDHFDIVNVVRTKPNTFTVHTSSFFCETVQGVHPDSKHTMIYTIDKGQIKQKCTVCKTKGKPRIHVLDQRVLNTLT